MSDSIASGSSTLSVHRCRFVDFTPAAITALAFPPLQPPSALLSAKQKDKGKAKSSQDYSIAKYGNFAVGRANGNIELCEWTGKDGEKEVRQAWVVRKTFSGPYPSKVDSLAFAIRFPNPASAGNVPTLSDLRLFSAGGGSELLEWDLGRSCIKRTINSQGGAIWSFAVNPASTLLALGCEDGAVRLLSLEHDTLSHLRRFDRAKCRLLSIAWGPPVPPASSKPKTTTAAQGDENQSNDDSDDEDDDWTDEWLVTGGSDSALRKWDVKTGRVTDRMTTDKARGERTLVWTVATLSDGTIVSGDSLGVVKFWDSRTGTQLQSFQGHAADVLCMTIGPDGTAVYTSGVDQKVTQFSLVKPSTGPNTSLLRTGNRWIQAASRRLHSHDVRALAIWPPYAPIPAAHLLNSGVYRFPADIAPILASGGLDMSVTLTPAALPRATSHRLVNPLGTSTSGIFEDAYHRRVAYPTGAAGTSALSLARGARMIACAADAGVSVWRILQQSTTPSPTGYDAGEFEDGPPGGWEKVLEIELAPQTNVVSSAISDDGRWLVVSDQHEVKLFSLVHMTSGDIKPKRIRDFAGLVQAAFSESYGSASASSPTTSSGCSACAFSPDSSKLVLATATSSHIVVFDLGDPEARQPRLLRKFDQHRLTGAGRTVRGRTVSVDADGDVDIEATPAGNDDGDEDENMDEEEEAVIGAVTRMTISADGQWLATTDDLCRTHVFNLDALQHHCVLPSLPQPAQTLAFDPSAPHLLIMALANNALEIFDVEARHTPGWARALTANLPKRFTHLHDAVLGVTFDPGAASGVISGTISGGAPGASTSTGVTAVAPSTLKPRHALFWGSTWICKVQLDAPVGWGGFSKKRRRNAPRPVDGPSINTNGPMVNGINGVYTNGNVVGSNPNVDADSGNFKLVTHYRPILLVDFIGPGELVVVERPVVDVMSGLPPAFWKPKYGAS